MLDQNTTAVLTTLIASLGALGGAITGAIISYQLTKRSEKRKKTTEVIEEVYTTVNQVKAYIDRISNDVVLAKANNVKFDGLPPTEIRPLIERIRTLVHLYIPALKKETKSFIDSLERFELSLIKLVSLHNSDFVEAEEETPKAKAFDNSLKAYEAFSQRQIQLQSSLEKMVR